MRGLSPISLPCVVSPREYESIVSRKREIFRRPRVLIVTLLALLVALGGYRVSAHFLHSANPCGALSGAAAAAFDSMVGEMALGVAHNVDSDRTEVERAVACGAGVIEFDVVMIDGQLGVAHDPPDPSMVASTPLLADLWPVAVDAGWVNLDIKDSSPAALDLLTAFLAGPMEPRPRSISVSSPDAAVLATVAERSPDVARFQSLGDEDQLGAFQAGFSPDVVTGVSIEEKLVNAAAVQWFRERGIDVWVWQVSDPLRAQELIELGVDGIITDNLVLLDALKRD